MKYKSKPGSKYSPLLGFFPHEVLGLPASLPARDHCEILGPSMPYETGFSQRVFRSMLRSICIWERRNLRKEHLFSTNSLSSALLSEAVDNLTMCCAMRENGGDGNAINNSSPENAEPTATLCSVKTNEATFLLALQLLPVLFMQLPAGVAV